MNGWWLADWSRHIAYTQRDTGRWLEAHLPADGVLLGDVAPGITTDTRLCAVNVMKGLCNDRDPLREFAGRPVYVAMLDGPHFRGPYWIERYPGVVAPTRRILHRRVLKWWIGIYPAPGAAAASEPPPIPP